MNNFSLLLFVLLLTGCTGIGVVATDDPYKKIGQAYYLMSDEVDRLLLAEDMIGQALESFTSSGDKTGMAEAYHAYGNLYKNRLYINGRWTAKFKSLGTYDGTYMKSIENFSKCQKLFEDTGNEIGESTCFMGMGNAYSSREEKDKACENYAKSLSKYEAAKQSPDFQEPQLLTGYKYLDELINAFIKQEKCNI